MERIRRNENVNGEERSIIASEPCAVLIYIGILNVGENNVYGF